MLETCNGVALAGLTADKMCPQQLSFRVNAWLQSNPMGQFRTKGSVGSPVKENAYWSGWSQSTEAPHPTHGGVSLIYWLMHKGVQLCGANFGNG